MSTLKKDDKRKPYHHGDLRNTLIRVGTEMLREGGEASLSLRKLARRAGVSHNAPYQHFVDKEALLAAIAKEGFDLLAAAVEEADAALQSADVLTRLVAAYESYARFAIENDSHFRLMFGPMSQSAYPELQAASMRALYTLQRIVEEGQARGELAPGDPAEIAFVLWTSAHGLSSAWTADKIPPPLAARAGWKQLVALAVRQIASGLMTEPRQGS